MSKPNFAALVQVGLPLAFPRERHSELLGKTIVLATAADAMNAAHGHFAGAMGDLGDAITFLPGRSEPTAGGWLVHLKAEVEVPVHVATAGRTHGDIHEAAEKAGEERVRRELGELDQHAFVCAHAVKALATARR